MCESETSRLYTAAPPSGLLTQKPSHHGVGAFELLCDSVVYLPQHEQPTAVVSRRRFRLRVFFVFLAWAKLLTDRLHRLAVSLYPPWGEYLPPCTIMTASQIPTAATAIHWKMGLRRIAHKSSAGATKNRKRVEVFIRRTFAIKSSSFRFSSLEMQKKAGPQALSHLQSRQLVFLHLPQRGRSSSSLIGLSGCTVPGAFAAGAGSSELSSPFGFPPT